MGLIAGYSLPVPAGSASPNTYWPAQTSASYLPAVRNRNPSGETVAAGRGFGMNTRHAYTAWNVSAQTGSAPTALHITNNLASGSGSFSAVLNAAPDNAVIIFDKGGIFPITADVSIAADNLWLAGQTAPSLPWIQSDGNDKVKIKTGTQIFVQHCAFWQNCVTSTQQDIFEVFNSGSTSATVVIDHCYFGGGTDECISIDNRWNVTLMDSMVSNPRGNLTLDHAYGSIIGSNNHSLIGNVYANCVQRSPLWEPINGTICNQLIYNAADNNILMNFPSGGNTGTWNLEGVCTIEGPDVAQWTMSFYVFATPSSASEVYINDSRHVFTSASERTIIDEWDVVSDPSGNGLEAVVRVETRVAAAWPEGLVAASNRAKTKEQYTNLLTNNVGPFPNARPTFLQDIIDEISTQTGGIANDYTPPALATTSATFVLVSAPHAESGTDPGRTNLEVQLLDLAEGLLN